MLTSDQNGSSSSNTAAKQQATERLKPFRFKKGDPRINRTGRPRTFDQCRDLVQKIAHEELQLKDGSKISVVEDVLRSLAKGDTRAKEIFLQYGYGKVPDKIHMGDIDGKPTTPMVIQVITPAAVPSNARCN